MFVEGTRVWSLYSLLLVAGYSVIFAILCAHLKIKSFLMSAMIHYAVSIASFLILATAIAEYNEGYQIMLSFGIFTACFTVISAAIFLIKRSIIQSENEEKAYKPMFD